MEPIEFRVGLRDALQAQGVFGSSGCRQACARRAAVIGDEVLKEVEAFTGASTFKRAMEVTRGSDFAGTYRYVAGYGELMTCFLAAPAGLQPQEFMQVARLGALANLLVSYFDELVDSGWRRSLLLPAWALAISSTGAGRALLGSLAHIGHPPALLSRRLVVEYFHRLAKLPHLDRHAVRADLLQMIRKMYMEEGRTPAEWRRLRGDAVKQKKTAFPLAVLGLPAWLAATECPVGRYARHRRWLLKLGRFMRWIDDAADLALDTKMGSANLVRRALSRRPDQTMWEIRLIDCIACRGRWLLDEWQKLVEPISPAPPVGGAVVAAALASWLGAPDDPA
jgi:hypothetical protein